MKKTLKRFFLVSAVGVGVGCSHAPTPTNFDGDWKFCTPPPTALVVKPEPMACLLKQDVMKLREMMLKCEAKYIK